MVDYEILATGSQGNATLINKNILIDCGVPFYALENCYRSLKLVLLTHIHSDHYKPSTIKKLALERPTLRFGCCWWMKDNLIDCGVNKKQIDVYYPERMYGYNCCNIITHYTKHNVPNCCYKILTAKGKIFYATDCNNLNGISAPNYDLYLVEANYEDDVIEQKIADKKENGEYIYEYQVKRNHLSKAKADAFIYSNIGSNGTYCYMHCHKDEENASDEYNNRNIG